MFVLVVFVWLALTTLFGVISVCQGAILGGLCCLLVGWGPVVLIAQLDRKRLAKRSAEWARVHAEMLAAGGVAGGQGLDHSEDGTGIAINPQQRMVLLLAGGVFKSYDYEDVREWEAREERAGVAGGVGVRGALEADAVNARNARRAAQNTGFFVKARDRQSPEWRIAMKDKATRARWMEIFEQEINEGRQAARG